MSKLLLGIIALCTLTSCAAYEKYVASLKSQSVQVTVDGQTRTVGLGYTHTFRDKDGSKPTTVVVESVKGTPTPTPTP